MAQSFRVAVVGNQGAAESFFSFEYGLQVFDLCADQICQLMEKPNMNIATELGAIPTMQYSVMGGGRFFPSVSREELAQTLQGVEMVIFMMSTQAHFMTYVSHEFFSYMFTEKLAEGCRHVVVRITNPDETEGKHQGRRRRSQGNKMNVDQTMKMYGFEKQMIKTAKVFVIADEAKQSKKKAKKGQTKEDAQKRKIAELRSELTGEEIKIAVTQPIKETVSASKALLGLGQRFGNWLGSLVKSQS